MSSLNDGKRINNVEDVLSLGQPIEVRVDDIDPQGKVSLSLAGAPPVEDRGPREDRPPRQDRAPREDRAERTDDNGSTAVATASFEDAFEAELVADLGDLGPGAAAGERSERGSGGGRPPRNRSRRR
jgi:polyribonucleotide nucleotidyltransferase